jgi:hypothetical protein
MWARPDHALKLGPRSAAWVKAGRGWSGRLRPQCHVAALPDGAIRPSPLESNIADPPGVANHLAALIRPREPDQPFGSPGFPKIPRPVVLVLPDLCARAALLRMDSLPDRRTEQESLIRWRLEQDRLFPMAGTRLGFQVFKSSDQKAESALTVLAVVIREQIQAQYETLCADLGLNPVDVGIASLRLWNLWVKGGEGRRVSPSDDVVLVSLLDGGLTTAIFQRGIPRFFRVKGLPAPRGSENGTPAEAMLKEVASSIHYYQDRQHAFAPKRLLLFSEEPFPSLGQDMAEMFEVAVSEPGWDAVQGLGWGKAPQEPSATLMAAVAGLAGRF